MRVTAVQLCSNTDRNHNWAEIEKYIRAAAAERSDMVVLPEACSYRGPADPAMIEDLSGPTIKLVSGLAKSLGIAVHVGGLWTKSGDDARPYNTAVYVDAAGAVRATYNKLHLFQVHGEEVEEDEAAYTTHGSDMVIVKGTELTLGVTICYDLRFPELFRVLAAAGAELMLVPSNFSMFTGRDHFELLLRARAAENNVYVVGAAQVGLDPAGAPTYGRSMIIDPWGTVLAQAPDEPGIVTADLKRDRIAKVRAILPAFHDRRPDIYVRPIKEFVL